MRRLILPLFLLILCHPLFAQFPDSLSSTPESPARTVTEIRPVFISDFRWFDLNFGYDELSTWVSDYSESLRQVFASDDHKRNVKVILRMKPHGKPGIELLATPDYEPAQRTVILRKLRRLPVKKPAFSECALMFSLRLNEGHTPEIDTACDLDPDSEALSALNRLDPRQQRLFLRNWAKKEGLPMARQARAQSYGDMPEYARFERFLARHAKDPDILAQLDRNPDYWALQKRDERSPYPMLTTRILLLMAQDKLDCAGDYVIAFSKFYGSDPDETIGVLLNRATIYLKSATERYHSLLLLVFSLYPERDWSYMHSLIVNSAKDYPNSAWFAYLLSTMELGKIPSAKLTDRINEDRQTILSRSPLFPIRYIGTDAQSAFADERRTQIPELNGTPDTIVVRLRSMAEILMDNGEYGFSAHLYDALARIRPSSADETAYYYCLSRLGIPQPDSLSDFSQITKARKQRWRDSRATHYWETYPRNAVIDFEIARALYSIDSQTGLEHARSAVEAGIEEAVLYRGYCQMDSDPEKGTADLRRFIAFVDSLAEGQRVSFQENLADAYYTLFEQAYSAKDSLALVAYLDKAIELCPESRFYRTRAALRMEQGEPEGALNDCNALIHNGENTAGDYALRGSAELSMELFGAALSDFTQARKLQPRDIRSLEGRSIAYLELGDYQNALADCDTLVVMQPGEARLYYQRGSVLFHIREYEKALADLLRANELEADNPVYLNLLAITLRKCGKNEQALENIEHALRLQPDNRGYYSAKADILVALGRPQEAVQVYRLALSTVASEDILILLSMAELLIVIEEGQESTQILEQCRDLPLSIEEKTVLDFLAMINCILADGDYSDLESSWQASIATSPNLSWWSFLVFDAWLEKAPLDAVRKDRIRAWENTMQALQGK